MSININLIILFILFISVVYYFYIALCLFKIAQKTKTPNTWFAWVPVLNFLLMLNIAKKPNWWILLFFIPMVNIIMEILVWMRIAKALRKPEWLGILMIFAPINLVVSGYLAFSSCKKNVQGPTVIVST